LINWRYKSDIKLSPCNLLTNKIKIHLNIFGGSMKTGISSHVRCTQIVASHTWNPVEPNTHLTNDTLQPYNLSNCISHCLILSFSARSGDCGLLPCTPSDEIRTKKDGKPASSPAIISITCPISIRKGTQKQRITLANLNAQTTSTM
jgi:hypothetical protein